MYNNILVKYPSITLDEFKTAINELSEWIWKCTDDATVNLAIMDLIVNGDIYSSNVSRYGYIYGKYPNVIPSEFIQSINELSEWIWKCTDNAIVNLAIMDLIVNGDIGRDDDETKLGVPLLTINSEYTASLTPNVNDSVTAEEYIFYANEIEIYSGTTSFIRLPNLMASLELPYGDYNITGKVVNISEDIYSPVSNSVIFNYYDPNILKAPTISLAGNSIIMRSDDYNIEYILYANDIIIYQGTSTTIYLPTALLEKNIGYGEVTLKACTYNSSTGYVSEFSKSLVYVFSEEIYISKPIVFPTTVNYVIQAAVTGAGKDNITAFIWYINDNIVWTDETTDDRSIFNIRAAAVIYNGTIPNGDINIKVVAVNREQNIISDSSDVYVYNYNALLNYFALYPPVLDKVNDYQVSITVSDFNCGIELNTAELEFINVDDNSIIIRSIYYSPPVIGTLVANTRLSLEYERDYNNKTVPYGTYKVRYLVHNNYYDTSSPFSNEVEIVFSE